AFCGGVQAINPFVGLMVASGGEVVSSRNVSTLVGISESVALFVTNSVWPAVMVRSAISARTGGLLLSSTTMGEYLVAHIEGVPSSLTLTKIRFVLGPWASVGVQVKIPFVGSIAAPAGALVPRLKVRVFAGMSESLARFVITSKSPSTIVRSATGAREGAL